MATSSAPDLIVISIAACMSASVMFQRLQVFKMLNTLQRRQLVERDGLPLRSNGSLLKTWVTPEAGPQAPVRNR
jgi:hypothetical protein